MEFKSFPLDEVATNEQPGFFTGKASVYGVLDLGGDVVRPGAFTKSLAASGHRVLICNQHDQADPIGTAILSDTPEALLVTEGRLVMDLASARDMYVRMKSGLVTGLSIGYDTVDSKMERGARNLLECKLWEVSPVTFPMCEQARVTDVKHAGAAYLARAWALAEELKAGRVLSEENRRRVTDALDACRKGIEAHGSVADALQALLDAADGKAAEERANKALEELSAALAALKL